MMNYLKTFLITTLVEQLLPLISPTLRDLLDSGVNWLWRKAQDSDGDYDDVLVLGIGKLFKCELDGDLEQEDTGAIAYSLYSVMNKISPELRGLLAECVEWLWGKVQETETRFDNYLVKIGADLLLIELPGETVEPIKSVGAILGRVKEAINIGFQEKGFPEQAEIVEEDLFDSQDGRALANLSEMVRDL